jgi:hypothetical protein
MSDYAQQVREAGIALAAAVVAEMELEARKPSEKSDAIRRLMGSENAETGKPHSASSAEKIVETDRDYAEFLVTMRQAVFSKIIARADYDAAVVAGRLASAEVVV